MPQKTSAEMLSALQIEIANIACPADSSEGAPDPASFLCLSVPGLTVSAGDFDLATADGRSNLYQMMDRLPAFNKQYIDSTKRCSDMYRQILSANPPADDPDAAAMMKTRYDAALAYLTDDVLDAYYDCQDAYLDAMDDLLSLQNEQPTDASAVRKAMRARDRAYNTWVVKGKKQAVEAALDDCASYLLCTPQSVFADAGKEFEEALDDTVGFYPVSCVPSAWATDPEGLSWAHVVVKHDSSVSKTHNALKQIDSDFSVGFAHGLWSAGGEGGYHDRVEQVNESSSVDSLGVSFDMARVDILRPWFKTSLLTYPGTTIGGMPRGGLCAGTLSKAGDCTFPFVPTSFVVARNIAVYNDFSDEERSFIEESESWSAGAKIGFGPFSLGNDTSVSEDLTDEEKKEFGDSLKMTVGQGMQIIGYVNSILSPAFPSADSLSTDR